MEIPKNGKCYLAWHKSLGMMFIHWIIPDELFAKLMNQQPSWHAQTLKDGSMYRFNPYDRDIVRWMDENGIWHEVIKDIL
jgi:hypothetical protein